MTCLGFDIERGRFCGRNPSGSNLGFRLGKVGAETVWPCVDTTVFLDLVWSTDRRTEPEAAAGVFDAVDDMRRVEAGTGAAMNGLKWSSLSACASDSSNVERR